MARIYQIGDPALANDYQTLSEKLGQRAASTLYLSAYGVHMTPGFIISLRDVKDSDSARLKDLLSAGIAGIEGEVTQVLGKNSTPLVLRVDIGVDLKTDFSAIFEPIGLSLGELNDLSESVGEARVSELTQLLLASSARLRKSDLFSDASDLDERPAERRDDVDLEAMGCLSQLEMIMSGISDDYFRDPLNEFIPATAHVRFSPLCLRQDMVLRRQFESSECLSQQADDGRLNALGSAGLDPETIVQMERYAYQIEKHFLDTRSITALLLSNGLWVEEIADSEKATPETKLEVVTRLYTQGDLTTDELIRSILPQQLRYFYHPTINPLSVETFEKLVGGLVGSPGATTGQVYFSSDRLIEAYWENKTRGRETDLILVQESTQAQDLEAVNLCQGVITSKGGYTSHAPIVARYLGKPSLVTSEIQFGADHIMIEGIRIVEGDEITLDLNDQQEPAIYLGRGEVIPSRSQNPNLKILLDAADEVCQDISIMANADTPHDIQRAIEFGAQGIGLCRTEHMFQREDRLTALRTVILTPDSRNKDDTLAEVYQFLLEDFKAIFKIILSKPIAIRLLDIPTHEIFPTATDETPEGINQLALSAQTETKSVLNRLNRMKEANPMLGLRGCRLGLSRPEIYMVQISAIIDALIENSVNQTVAPSVDILIPFVMNERELEIIRNGVETEGYLFKGFNQILTEKRQENGLKQDEISVKIGIMVETPAAALGAASFARRSELISFGTNDLIQTTLGVSRDDIQSILPIYMDLEIWTSDPFQSLPDEVKDLIAYSARSGTEVRPDLRTGICGENSSDEDTIRFCLEEGIDYISCAPISVPVARLTAARAIVSG